MNQFINTRGSLLIYLSSGAVYGNVEGRKSNESDKIAPNTFYGFTKYIAEKNILFYSKNKIFDYIILRLPNVYGKKPKKGSDI